ncbi:MAG: 3' terminal RNA ribose 2'-O-methyltransferase Hen1 [Actinomycetales bacterium]|nr:3' terminal RNA ribose 2'-O-methyltransferase Hen1 [Actinomycetales bacterium]
MRRPPATRPDHPATSQDRPPTTDLGFLLHKHPHRVQAFEVATGTAHVFFPEATEDRCTAALLLEVDPVGLVRGRGEHRDQHVSLWHYVNDRPYAASSMLATAIGRVFRTAMRGRCSARPELAADRLPLELHVPALPCRGGPELAHRLFAPLGWQVTATAVPLDETVPAWGDSRYVDLRLSGELRLADALNHLYVLLPVLDDAKHYWVSPEEVDKLVRAGTGWLAAHPDKQLITRRYLAHRSGLTRSALARLAEVDDADPDALDDAVDTAEIGDEPDRPVPLARQRQGAVLAALRAAGARRVGDLGCGQGDLVPALLAEPSFTEIVVVDVSVRALEIAGRRLRLDRMPERRRQRLRVFQSSLTYRDDRLTGLDAAVLMEVVEHVDPSRLAALETTVFGAAAPGTVIVTTPNVEYNVRFDGLAEGALRHRDHRFEWTRAEFGDWAHRVADRFGYRVRLLPVGPVDPEVGPPTQLAVFSRTGSDEEAPR